ncbi:hypothetical protein DSM43518_05633 [Mycobacterium marinum]|uniref:hypothetical protein n=1 Tax=Mycobacterium marinum TaxID=1781 RepID=UPI000ED74782|nr:hypothetical protein [Mycobacterium marinum]RFZ01140.1 hypothetical protein DSM43518_05633 [Mycobacterium marinum]
MKKMGKGSAAARQSSPGPAPPQGAPAPSAAALPASGKGFRATFRDAVARKFRELTGQKWQAASESQKRAEATRRATNEVARRIERLTGKRPADSTIRRNASKNTTPKGADQQLLDRQAVIDRAGGIKQFAATAGVSQRKVTQWRDTGTTTITAGPPDRGAVYVIFDITCDIYHPSKHRGDTPDYDRHLDNTNEPLNGADLVVNEPDASTLLIAYASGDDGTVKEILSRQLEITILSEWHGPSGKRAVVTHIEYIDIRT